MKNDTLIKKAENGTYYFRANLGTDPVTGKRIQKYKSGFKTKKEATAAYAQLILNSSNSEDIKCRKMRFNKFLDEIYFPWYRMHVRENTFIRTSYVISNHSKYFKNVYLDEIEAIDVQKWQLFLMEKYNPNYINVMQKKFANILDRAIILGFAEKNYFKEIGYPRREKPEMNFWTVSEFKKVLRTFHKEIYTEHCDYITFLLLFMSGMRKGEALALQWSDINFETGACSISKSLYYKNINDYKLTEPKTKASNRIITLDKDTLKELNEWKVRQQSILPCCTFVLSFDGLPTPPNSVSLKLNRAADSANIHRIRVHDLRHSHVAMLINLGMNSLFIQKRLGHSNVNTTLGVYGHLYPGVDLEAADKLTSRLHNEKIF